MALNFEMSDLEYSDNSEWFQYAENINSYTDLGLLVGKVQKPIMPQVQESIQDVPGMYGNIFMGNDYGELTFNIPVTLMAFDKTSYNIICENMRAVFTQDSENPGVEYPLVFGDRPEIKYYGHWGQMSAPTFITPNDWQARATLTFICSQPYGYMDQQDLEVDYPNQPIIPKGNAKTYPIYQIYLKKDIYNVGFASTTAGGAYVATGYRVDDNNTDSEGNRLKDKEPLDTNEDPTTFDDWIASGTENKQIMTFQIDGDQAGQMGERNGGGITPASVNHTDKNRPSSQQSVQTLNYGNPANHKDKWYGPLAIHPQFDNPTNDWRLMVNLWNRKTSSDHSSNRAMGHNEIYLLDENGHRRGRIFIHDWQKGEFPRIGFQLGRNYQDEVAMVDVNDPSDSGAAGPHKIGNYNYQRDRGNVSFTVTSLYSYKQAVKTYNKSKQRKTRRKLNNNRKTNAKLRRTRSDKGKKRGPYKK